MVLVKKTIELDQEAITRIKTALNAKSEKEAINFVLQQVNSHREYPENGTFTVISVIIKDH